MGANLREYPVVTGKDAQRLLAKIEKNNNNIKKIVASKLNSLKND